MQLAHAMQPTQNIKIQSGIKAKLDLFASHKYVAYNIKVLRLFRVFWNVAKGFRRVLFSNLINGRIKNRVSPFTKENYEWELLIIIGSVIR